MPPSAPQPPSPALIQQTLSGCQRAFALKTAIELDLFSAIGDGAATAAELAQKLSIAERGARILCDFLVVANLLTKSGNRYALTPDTATYLDRRSPAYVGSVAEFLLGPEQQRRMANLTASVRAGGNQEPQPIADFPGWVTFARAMAPYMARPAELLAERFGPVQGRILDIAAGHGLFGLAFARRSPSAEVFALDAAPVLEVAKENAARAGLAARYHPMPGDAMQIALGENYELILLANFLHHFDAAANIALLRRIRAALAPGGRVVTLEFVPNPDRVSPPPAAAFSLTMLANTPAGDAYTFAEFQAMFSSAGFAAIEEHSLGENMETALLARAG